MSTGERFSFCPQMRRHKYCTGKHSCAVRSVLGEQRTASHQLSDAMTLRRYLSVPLSLPFFGIGWVEVIASATVVRSDICRSSTGMKNLTRSETVPVSSNYKESSGFRQVNFLKCTLAGPSLPIDVSQPKLPFLQPCNPPSAVTRMSE